MVATSVCIVISPYLPGWQFSGPGLEMDHLGAHERPTDTSTGLIQMGARSYSPELGAFLSEDPVFVMVGGSQFSDRYVYAADRTPNLTDLTGRFSLGGVFDGVGDIFESWAEDPLNFGDPRELVKSAQEYWVNSDSPLAYPAGSVVSIVDLAVNPDRLNYYLKSNHLPNKEVLADCYRGGHPARHIGGIVGGLGGFGAGVASAGDLGRRSIGVGAISGKAGAAIGAGVGSLGGCAVGIIGGYF